MPEKILTGVILDERVELSLHELSRACSVSTERIVELVGEGVLEPVGQNQERWRFSGLCLQRAHTAMRLQRDLEINLAGVALALDLMDEIDVLRGQLCRFESGHT